MKSNGVWTRERKKAMRRNLDAECVCVCVYVVWEIKSETERTKIIYLPKISPNNDFRQFKSSESDSKSCVLVYVCVRCALLFSNILFCWSVFFVCVGVFVHFVCVQNVIICDIHFAYKCVCIWNKVSHRSSQTVKDGCCGVPGRTATAFYFDINDETEQKYGVHFKSKHFVSAKASTYRNFTSTHTAHFNVTSHKLATMLKTIYRRLQT